VTYYENYGSGSAGGIPSDGGPTVRCYLTFSVLASDADVAIAGSDTDTMCTVKASSHNGTIYSFSKVGTRDTRVHPHSPAGNGWVAVHANSNCGA
jgi:hypothetical protein